MRGRHQPADDWARYGVTREQGREMLRVRKPTTVARDPFTPDERRALLVLRFRRRMGLLLPPA